MERTFIILDEFHDQIWTGLVILKIMCEFRALPKFPFLSNLVLEHFKSTSSSPKLIPSDSDMYDISNFLTDYLVLHISTIHFIV